MSTILSMLYEFISNHKGDIASKMLASAGYDMLKNSINFKSLKNRIKGYFKKDEQTQKFIEDVCNNQVTETSIENEIAQLYKGITGSEHNSDLLSELRSWVSENQNSFNQFNVQFSNTSGFNIGNQSAGRDIYNIQGDNKINRNEEDKD
jgi:hypothetical protein